MHRRERQVSHTLAQGLRQQMGQIPHERVQHLEIRGPQRTVRYRQVPVQQVGRGVQEEEERRRGEGEKAQGREGQSRGQEESRD